MAPQSRKRKSEAIEDVPQAVTPTGSPAQKKMKITLPQKQALIDNLQLEITERARHLRAHYALQCSDLRARIERRVNRIPMAMRKMTMRELIAKHAEMDQPRPKSTAPQSFHSQVTSTVDLERPLPAVPQEHAVKPSPTRSQIQPPSSRNKKRKSSAINIALDQENVVQASEDLPVLKNNKRTKATGPTRATSRTGKHPSVLSPRSHNSRTLPRSPIKDYPVNPSSPTRSMIARPVSPLKPASPFKSAASAATTAITASVHGMIEHAKRGTAVTTGKLSRTTSREKTTTASTASKGKMLPPPRPLPSAPLSPQRNASQSSNYSTASDMSTNSTTTTVITQQKRGRAAKATVPAVEKKSPAAMKGAASRAASAAKTALKKNASSVNKKVVVAEPAAGRRVLRKRN